MEGGTEKSTDPGKSADLEGFLARWLKKLSLSKGALLVRDDTGQYNVAVSVGLSGKSSARLKIEESENIFRRFLSRGKLLYIIQDAFLHESIREKFDATDAQEIGSLFFAPISAPAGTEGAGREGIPVVLLVCVTKGEGTAQEIITKEIKRIKKILLKYL